MEDTFELNLCHISPTNCSINYFNKVLYLKVYKNSCTVQLSMNDTTEITLWHSLIKNSISIRGISFRSSTDKS